MKLLTLRKHLPALMLLSMLFIFSNCNGLTFYLGEHGTEGEELSKYLEPSELEKLVETPDSSIWIIDVRPTRTHEKGAIPTAKSFPSSEIEERLDELPKDKYLIIYCETGGRVHSVIKKLEAAGYTRYINWAGYSRWKNYIEDKE